MKNLTKGEFRDWMDHPVTHAVFMLINQRIAGLKEMLEEQAGLDPLQDRFIAGNIRAYRNLLETDWDDVTNG